MPAPTSDDPDYCPGSGSADFQERPGRAHDLGIGPWWVCRQCRRALVPTQSGRMRRHRVRSRTTASLDATRDVLADITLQEIEHGLRTDA